jgi:hypothetical protein
MIRKLMRKIIIRTTSIVVFMIYPSAMYDILTIKISNSITGVWRNDDGDLFIISSRGQIMNLDKKFSGLVFQLDRELSFVSFHLDDRQNRCEYSISQPTKYYLRLNLKSNSSPEEYCPAGLYHKVDDAE